MGGVGLGQNAEEAVMLFRRDLIAGVLPFTVDDVRRELNGSDLNLLGAKPALHVTRMFC